MDRFKIRAWRAFRVVRLTINRLPLTLFWRLAGIIDRGASGSHRFLVTRNTNSAGLVVLRLLSDPALKLGFDAVKPMSVRMIASLMMYARPELEAAHRRYWALIRDALAARGIDAPETLSNDIEEFAVWEAPDLILSQTCGMPYRLSLHGKVQLVGTPDFGVEGCPPGYYRSAIVVRADDARLDLAAFRDARFAYNQTISQSGYAAPYAVAQRHGFWFANREQSGGHIKSAKAVAEGHADIAAIDAVTWRLIERYDDFAETSAGSGMDTAHTRVCLISPH